MKKITATSWTDRQRWGNMQLTQSKNRKTNAPKFNRPLAILGAYGGLNVGDEIICHAAVHLSERGTDGTDTLIIGGPDMYGRYWEHDPADALKFVSWRNLIAAMRNMVGRNLIIGGGQIIDGRAGIGNPAVQLVLATVSRLTGGRIILSGVGAINLDRPLTRFLYRRLFRLASVVNCRDERSAETIRAISKSNNPQINTRNDLVFGLLDWLKGPVPAAQRNIIAVAIHHAPHLALTPEKSVADMIRRIRENVGDRYKIHLVPHDFRDDFDPFMIRKILERLQDDNIEVQNLRSADQVRDYYQQVRTIISIRMHPIIIGACAGCYCVPLAATNKLTDVAGRLRLPIHTVEETLELDAADFCNLMGIGGDGHLAATDELEAMKAEARRSLQFPDRRDNTASVNHGTEVA